MTTAVHTKTWAITTTSGHTTTGYLPPWAEQDPSQTAVPDQQLGKVLADICHYTEFSGQRMRAATDGGPGTDTVILGGSIDCHPYTDNPQTRIPVANLQIIDDHWIHNLDPWALATIAAKLHAQANYLNHEIRPALLAARTDWATHHTT
jgi:hypothetical protein